MRPVTVRQYKRAEGIIVIEKKPKIITYNTKLLEEESNLKQFRAKMVKYIPPPPTDKEIKNLQTLKFDYE